MTEEFARPRDALALRLQRLEESSARDMRADRDFKTIFSSGACVSAAFTVSPASGELSRGAVG